MFVNLAIGSVLISATVVVHTFGLIVLSRAMGNVVRWLRLHRHTTGRATAMVAAVLGLFLVHTVEVWIWAAAYLALGPLHSLSDALYFSTVTFSTIGYGDVTLGPDWRLLASMEGLNGFLLIGWSTAYLVAASTRYGPFRLGEHF